MMSFDARRQGRRKRPLDLAGILLTHAHTGHYAGLLQLGKEGADLKGVPVRSFGWTPEV